MTKQRKAASAALKIPLTAAEDAANHGKVVPDKPRKGKLILCVKCGRGGGTLQKIDEGKYQHLSCPQE